MCTNRKYVTNPYTGRRVLVNCGVCPACKQAKANRLANRLRQVDTTHELQLFVTLTYDNNSIPYILKSDLQSYDVNSISVYRDCRLHYGNLVSGRCVVAPLSSCVRKETTFIPFVENIRLSDGSFDSERMGVSLFKDFQDFKKRLRVFLSRKFSIETGCVSIFGTGEYGETYWRPHFHAILSLPAMYYKEVCSAVVASWPFHDWNIRYDQKLQIARDASAYVASYVNCPASLPQVLSFDLRPKRSFSPSLGMANSYFRLSSLLARADSSSLFYPRQVVSGGCSTVVNIPIPQYVLYRYFPKFKGFGRCTFDSLVLFISEPNRFTFHAIERECSPLIDSVPYHTAIYRFGNIVMLSSYTDYSIRKIITSVRNARDRYIRLTNKTGYDYAIDFVRVWSAYKSTLLRLSYESDLPLSELFDNWSDFSFNGSVYFDQLPTDVYDFNSIPHIVHQSEDLENLYRKKCKQKTTTDLIFSKFLNYEN